ncbi:MAG: 30S ribosomal protein S12 methylthiotransferase RimO [Nitrospirota bacterium]
MTKINITTLGCPKNVVDSGHLARRFVSEGFVHVDDPNNADIILVNTCGFIRDAKEESIEEILKLAKIKRGQGSRVKGQKKLVVFGCLAKRYRDELMKEIPEMDAIFGVGEDSSIIEYCKGLAIGKRQEAIGDIKIPVAYRPSPIASSYAYLKIAEGCDKKCTFCVIPSIRGRFRSIPPERILKEAEEHIKNGVRELILVAQDITKYGKDLAGYNLVSLLKDLASIKGDFRIRLLYLYPTEITDELLELIAKEDKIQKYLDIPLQHSEDKILRLMGRRGTRKEYIKLIRNIRKTIPGVALRTTFIVGFPGETEDDFHGLVDFIEEIRFDRLGVFTYSKEEGTSSSKLKGHVPEKVKMRRLDEIMRRQAAISLEKNKELIGRRYEAIVDEIDGNIAIARLYSHAPEIDGVVIIEQSAISSQQSALIVGDLVTVEIMDAFDYDLKGVLYP